MTRVTTRMTGWQGLLLTLATWLLSVDSQAGQALTRVGQLRLEGQDGSMEAALLDPDSWWEEEYAGDEESQRLLSFAMNMTYSAYFPSIISSMEKKRGYLVSCLFYSTRCLSQNESNLPEFVSLPSPLDSTKTLQKWSRPPPRPAAAGRRWLTVPNFTPQYAGRTEEPREGSDGRPRRRRRAQPPPPPPPPPPLGGVGLDDW